MLGHRALTRSNESIFMNDSKFKETQYLAANPDVADTVKLG